MQMSNLTTDQVEEYLKQKTSIVIPAGSVEQHSTMAPLACDTIIPVRLCFDAAKRSSTLVAPALSYGLSSSHTDFIGTISLRGSTLSMMVGDIVRSLYHHGFRKILFLSGHGGNRSAIMSGLADAGSDCPLTFMRYLGYWDLPGAAEKEIELFGEDVGWHVTASEVSMVWHLLRRKMPDTLRDKYPPAPAPGSVLTPYLWKKLYPRGGEGSDLSQASVEKGKELYEFLVSVLEDQLSRMENDSV
jgi:creatinine amidohydrolase